MDGMNALEEKRAFDKGVDTVCSEAGLSLLSLPLKKFAEYSSSFDLDPDSFARGFEKAVKTAGYDDRSFLRRILPWVLVPAAIYGASKYGEMWGRHANANGNPRGPVSGPFHSLLESLAGKKLRYVGRDTARVLSGPDLRPRTADELEEISRYGWAK